MGPVVTTPHGEGGAATTHIVFTLKKALMLDGFSAHIHSAKGLMVLLEKHRGL